jgi:phospholipid/cholesterol/gamma-HCH transport system substrate-binding protein
MQRQQIKVGIFVSTGLVLIGLFVFFIGDNRKLWEAQVHFDAAFGDVAGLKPGSPVRMGGIDVGTVGSVEHGPDANDARIYVSMSVVKTEAVRVRVDTVAKVVNKGLLGDKMMELTVADAKSPALSPGSRIKTEEPVDFSRYLSKLDSISEKADKAIGNIEEATRGFGDPKFSEDIRASTASLREVLDAVVHKDSALHRLLFDPKEAANVDRAIGELAGATGELHAAMSDVRAMTGEARNGPGLVHSLVYDGELSKSAAGALHEIHRDLVAVREGNGLVHALVYGDDKTQDVMGNVNAMTGDLRAIIAGVRAGKGTIGGLLVDPSVYEDIKSVVGNLERNQVLRALVRYSIKADEGKPKPVETSPRAPAPAQTP